MSDPRFSHIRSDPRFRRPSRRKNLVKVDDRFAGKLGGSDFMIKIDKYGRKIKDHKLEAQLKRFYEFDTKNHRDKDSSDDSDDSGDEAESGGTDVSEVEEKYLSSSQSSSPEENSESEEEGVEEKDFEEQKPTNGKAKSREKNRKASLDRARGEGISEDSSESETSDSDADDNDSSGNETVEQNVADIYDSSKVPMAEERSNILAVVNLDWENIRAVDILASFSAFVPSSGSIFSVKIYLSEFGKERLAQETNSGPPTSIYLDKEEASESEDDYEDSEDDSGDGTGNSKSKDRGSSDFTISKKKPIDYEEGSEFDQVALRKYELEKLKCYYAIAECDSEHTAGAIYDSIDSTEFESTANHFDIRFVPKDMEFSDDPYDMASKIPDNYRPMEFITTALQHSNVKLTWDTEDPKRANLKKKAFTDDNANLMDYKELLASSESESGSESDNVIDFDAESGSDDAFVSKAKSTSKKSEKKIKKDEYRKLLLSGVDTSKSVFNQKGRESFGGDGSDDETGNMEITFTPGLSNNILDGKNDHENETSIEKYMRKQKEKRLAKAEAKRGKLLTQDSNPKEKKKVVDDPFFALSEGSDGEDITKKGKSDKKLTKLEIQKKKDQEKAELELLLMDDNTELNGEGPKSSKHFDIKHIIKVGKKVNKKSKKRHLNELDGLQEDFELNPDDKRFAAIYNGSEFAIDPNAKDFKKTKGMQTLLSERRKRYARDNADFN